MEESTKTCVIKGCSSPHLPGELHCYTHHIEAKEAEWLDNTDIHDLGIVKWCRQLMPEAAFNKTPEFHKLLFYKLLGLYNPTLRNKYERLFEFISFRGSAKSTAANTLFVSYIIANNGKRFKYRVDGEIKEFLIDERAIIIISETGGSAEDFTVRIRDAFATNERLRYYYKYAIQQALDSDTGQWTRSAFKINNLYVQGVGSGMMIRGKVKGMSRPTLVIADDIYSENTIITEERRLRTKNWWNNAVMNSIDDLKGKVAVLGTILHEDTVLVELEKNPLWDTVKIPAMGHVEEDGTINMDLFHEFVNEHLKTDWEFGNCYLPFDDIENPNERRMKQSEYFDKVQSSKDWELQWPERMDLYMLAIKFKEAVYNNMVGGFYQEYFHVIVPPQQRRFKKEFFQKYETYDLKYEFGYNWLRIPGHLDDWTLVNIEFGVDMAGVGLDDSAVAVVALTSDYRVFLLTLVTGKWSLRDDVKGDTAHDLRRFRVVDSGRDGLERIGLADEIFRLSRRFRPSTIKIGVGGEEQLIVDEIGRLFRHNHDYTTYIRPRPQNKREGDKFQRISATLLPYYETRMIYHPYGQTKLEYQLEYLGKTKHDDCADAMECALWQVRSPEQLKYESFETSTNLINNNLNYPTSFNAKNKWWDPGYF